MVKFDGMPYPIAIAYLVTKHDGVVSMPFVELFDSLVDVSYDYAESKRISEKEGPSLVIKGVAENGSKMKAYVVAKKQFMQRISSSMYNDPEEIVDMVVQPEDELMTEEVQKLIQI
jgi:hypothetical protein